MKFIKYSKFSGDPFEGLSAEDLLQLLQDFLLGSGFDSQYYNFYEMDPERTMEQLHQALLEAMRDRGMIPQELLEQLLKNAENYQDSKLSDLINKLLERLAEEGYITIEQRPTEPGQITQPGEGGPLSGPEGKAKFEITDKALDFLGYKTLKDLLGSMGKSSFGRHDTRELATGVESHGATKRYEFGDTLNLDVNATLLSAIARRGFELPLDLEYQDLQVRQCEYQSSCATVLMLDCSHSMILYGEDRFTPATKLALVLAHLIRTQYPGDSLRCVLFHDGAEELAVSQLARVQVGPYYTNTRDGLILAQRLLNQERKDMRQIVMITDGKPSCLTLEDGRMYRNAFGLDPLVISRTLEEVNRCKKQGILINTFMLASDYGLINFIHFFFQAEDGIRYLTVTGVQTCALPILTQTLAARGRAYSARPLPAVHRAVAGRRVQTR